MAILGGFLNGGVPVDVPGLRNVRIIDGQRYELLLMRAMKRIANEDTLLATLMTTLPAVRQVVAFAPHPDDEVFGCGATLHLLQQAGAAVTVQILTDGAQGGDTGGEHLIGTRADESLAAAEVLGLPPPIFWGLPDRGLAYGEPLITRLVEAIRSTDADLILLPGVSEMHPDHQTLALAGVEAVRRLGGERWVAFYEISAPLPVANLLIDISAAEERKRDAMTCFTSQLAVQPYAARLAGLNRFRAYPLGKNVQAAEAFFMVPTTRLAGGIVRLFDGPPAYRQQHGHVADPDDLPLVSIIIRSMDRPTLTDALASLALQTYPHIEIIVVSAGGGQHRVLQEQYGSCAVRLVNQGGGPLPRAAAANAGLAACRGRYIGFLDDDDILDPDHIHHLVQVVQEAGTTVVAYAGVRGLRRDDPDQMVIATFAETTISLARLLLGNVLPIHASLFPATLLAEGVRFDEAFDLYEDWDFWMQLAQRLPFVFSGRTSATYFMGGQSGATRADGVMPEADRTARAHGELFAKWVKKMEADDLRVIRELHGQAIAVRDNQLATLAVMIKERDGLITALEQAVAQRNSRIGNLEQTAVERDNQLATLDAMVRERDSQVAALDAMVRERDALAATLETMVRERDEQLTEARHQRLLLAEQAAALNSRIEALIASRSWRITAPLRALGDAGRNVRQTFNKAARSCYQMVPLPPGRKQKFKHFVFRYFGFACRGLTAYQLWKSYHELQQTLSEAFPSPAAPTVAEGTVQGFSLSAADGVWEWADYQLVRERIRYIEALRLQKVCPQPLEIIDIRHDGFASAAKGVRLPTVGEQPDVSIIIPVYNNLKLTLECLLSISKHAEPSVSFEVIVADDSSTDGTAEFLGAIDNLRLVRNSENLGFLRNSNRALTMVRGRYTVFLNNDVQVTSGWLSSLLETFAAYPRAGAVGPRFLYPSGHLQELGVAFRYDGAADMVGLNDDPALPRFSYVRRVDYISGACLMLPTVLVRELGGFSEEFLPCYCEDSDLCLRVEERGYFVYCNPRATIIHHLSKTMEGADNSFKLGCITTNLAKLVRRWTPRLESGMPRLLAFYLPQYHPLPENNKWWGEGFTEWTNVTKARPNFVGHYQPRLPADLGYYDLRIPDIMNQQAELARRYGIQGFCYYYYWFKGKRLLELPLEQMLASGRPDFPFCLCWANENWTRRWDGQEHEVLMAQFHSPEDDRAVIADLARFFRDDRYIRVDGRPLMVVYRVTRFPEFKATAERWRTYCREVGIGEIYIAMVESFELVHAGVHPGEYGCDAAIEFPPQELAKQKPPSGAVINPDFVGMVADYRDLAVRYATRDLPPYTRFMGVTPGWDNTARRQNAGFCFEHATPGAFQAWLEEAIERTRQHQYGDERLVFINAWNEWAEGAYLEPDRRFGHTYLEAVKNALEAPRLLREPGRGGAAL